MHAASKFELKTQLIPGKGTSSLEDPSGVRITIPAGKQICYTSIGRWNPNLEGSAGLNVSSFCGMGSPVVDFKEGQLKIGEKVDGIPDKEWMAPKKNFFALLAREAPAPADRKKRKHVTMGGGGWAHISAGTSDRTIEFLMNDQYEEYYNNSDAVLLIYFIQDGSGLPWNVSLSDFDRAEQLSKLPTASKDASGILYDWEITGWNKYMSKGNHYNYQFTIKNTLKEPVKRYLWVKDNKGYVRNIFLNLKAEQGSVTSTYLKGISIDKIAFTEDKVDPFK